MNEKAIHLLRKVLTKNGSLAIEITRDEFNQLDQYGRIIELKNYPISNSIQFYDSVFFMDNLEKFKGDFHSASTYTNLIAAHIFNETVLLN